MKVIADPKQAGERLLTFAREGRLVQNTWHDEQDGREVACLLGAAAGIYEVNQCPASLMPAWVACSLPSLFDGQTADHAMVFARRWGEAMVRPEWSRIDWNTVLASWLLVPCVRRIHDASRSRDAQADAIMAAIEKAMEVARG